MLKNEELYAHCQDYGKSTPASVQTDCPELQRKERDYKKGIESLVGDHCFNEKK